LKKDYFESIKPTVGESMKPTVGENLTLLNAKNYISSLTDLNPETINMVIQDILNTSLSNTEKSKLVLDLYDKVVSQGNNLTQNQFLQNISIFTNVIDNIKSGDITLSYSHCS